VYISVAQLNNWAMLAFLISLFICKKTIPLLTCFTILDSTKIKLSKKCYTKRRAKLETPDFMLVSGIACSYRIFSSRQIQANLGKRASSLCHMSAMKILMGKQLYKARS
jgi:hypothetical protein